METTMNYQTHRWGGVSSGWLNHCDIGLDEWAVLSYLATCMRADGSGIEPSQSDIAHRLRTSRARINRILGRLADAGIIEKIRRFAGRGSETSCEYRIQIDAEGNVVPIGTSVPSVLRQVKERREQQCPVTPVSQHATSGVTLRYTNQESKIQDSLSTPEGANLNERDGRQGWESPPGAKPAQPITSMVARTMVDEHWAPSQSDIAWAAEHCPDLDILLHTQIYIAGCKAKGYVYEDHSWGWRSWALTDRGKSRSRPKGQGGGGGRTRSRPDAAAPSLHRRNAAASEACLARINERNARREACR
jgi:hypothetical protein